MRPFDFLHMPHSHQPLNMFKCCASVLDVFKCIRLKLPATVIKVNKVSFSKNFTPNTMGGYEVFF